MTAVIHGSLRQHFRVDGVAKKGFTDETEAKVWLESRNIHGHAYQCSWCERWHTATRDFPAPKALWR